LNANSAINVYLNILNYLIYCLLFLYFNFKLFYVLLKTAYNMKSSSYFFAHSYHACIIKLPYRLYTFTCVV